MASEPRPVDRLAQAPEAARDFVSHLMAIERTSYLLVLARARDSESEAAAPCPACGGPTFSRTDETRWACKRCHRIGDIFDAWGWVFVGERLPKEAQMRKALPRMARLFPSHEQRQAQAEDIERPRFKRRRLPRGWLPPKPRAPARPTTYRDWTDEYREREA